MTEAYADARRASREHAAAAGQVSRLSPDEHGLKQVDILSQHQRPVGNRLHRPVEGGNAAVVDRSPDTLLIDREGMQGVAHGADLGVALDGDADRVILCDETGTVVDGDQVMAMIARSWQAAGRVTGGGVVATVMSNLGLEKYLETIDLKLERTSVGDRYVLERMRAAGFNLGGEQSGHLILSDYSTTGDGLIAALQVLAAFVESGTSMSAFASVFEPYPQLLKNVRVADRSAMDAPSVKAKITAAEEKLGGDGRVLIRPSGTEPLIRVMAEGLDEALVTEVVDEIADAIAAVSA